MNKKLVIALGGNALGNTSEEQLQLVKKAAKNKEPIRPNRLCPRWGVYIKLQSPLKFRVAGRRNPSIKKVKNKFLRIKS